MIVAPGLGVPTVGQNENEDPFVVTPPRKYNPGNHTRTPATPNSKSTSLHKRFLEEVTMSPNTPTTPPRTPSKSPRKDQRSGKQTLEVGQNGFYFSMEIPEKKILTPKRTATVTPSLSKEKKSEANGGGRVKDILRRNLFGTPTKKTTVPKTNVEREKGMEKSSEAKMSPLKDGELDVPIAVSQIGRSSRNRGPELPPSIKQAQNDNALEATTRIAAAPAPQSSCHLSQATALSPPIFALSKTDGSTMSSGAFRMPRTHSSTLTTTTGASTAPNLDLQKVSATSTPSDIGHLMAGLSNKNAKIQVLPIVGASETMPTPLRKMSERLGLKSPHVVRKDSIEGNGHSESSISLQNEKLNSQITFLGLRDAATVENDPAIDAPTRQADAPNTSMELRDASVILGEPSHIQLLKSPIMVTSPAVHSRPSTATTSSSLSSTPSRPGPSIMTKRLGTPDPLRSSIQKDMHNMQESLKRSLGSGFTLQTCNSRPATPVSCTATATHGTVSTTNCNVRRTQKVARPVSMIGPAEPSKVSSTQAAPRRLLNTATRKPRPKSMIVGGSAKMLETAVSQIDSPRERAKLRSAAAIPSSARSGPATSRPGTAMSQSKAISSTSIGGPVSKPDPIIHTTKSAPLRAAPHPGRSTPSPLITVSHRRAQEPASAPATNRRVVERKTENRKGPAPEINLRTKSANPACKRTLQPTNERTAKTPESKDPKIGSRLGQSYTPPGNPTRLPAPVKSPSKIRLVVPATPAPKKTVLSSNAAKLRTPLPVKTPANGQVDSKDPNAMRTPSKEIESSLDRAIDAKIAEDARSGKEFTPSGNRISELLEAKRGLTARGRLL